MNHFQGIGITAFGLAGLILSGCFPIPTPIQKTRTDDPEIVTLAQTDVNTAQTTTNSYDAIDPTGQTITFWHTYPSSREKALLAMIDDFNKSNPWNITVTTENQSSTSSTLNKMFAVLNTPEAPNLMLASQTQAANYQLADTLININDLVYSPRWGLNMTEQEDIFGNIFKQDIFPDFGNARLGFPLDRSMDVLYYNQDWLRELGYRSPPQSPELFKEITCKAAQKPYSRVMVNGSTGYELDIDAHHFASWAFAFGGDIFDNELKQYTFDNQEAITTWIFIQGLFNDRCATLVEKEYGDQDDFSNGKLLFTIDSSANMPFYKTAVDKGARFNWDVSAIPHTGVNPSMNVYGLSASIPKTTPEAQLAAWLFLKFTIDPQVQANYVKDIKILPTRTTTAKNLIEDLTNDTAYKTTLSLLPYARSEPSIPGYDFVSKMIKEALAAIVAGADVKQTLIKLNLDANSSLAEQLAQLKK